MSGASSAPGGERVSAPAAATDCSGGETSRMDNLDLLEAVARAATPGPWQWVDVSTDEPCTPDHPCQGRPVPSAMPQDNEHNGVQFSLRTVEVFDTATVGPLPKFVISTAEQFHEVEVESGVWHHPDAEFIAAFSPDVALRLIGENRRLSEGTSALAAMTPMLAQNSAQRAIDHVFGHLFEQDPMTGHLRLRGGATEVSEGVMRHLIREAVDGST